MTTNEAELLTCVRCGDEYEPYHVLVRDDFVELAEMAETKRKWNLHEDGNDGFCKPCRVAVTNYGAFTGASEVEPKTEVQ